VGGVDRVQGRSKVGCNTRRHRAVLGRHTCMSTKRCTFTINTLSLLEVSILAASVLASGQYTVETTIQHLLVRDTCFVTSTTKKAPMTIVELLRETIPGDVISMRWLALLQPPQ
jgi:hypothetical protein